MEGGKTGFYEMLAAEPDVGNPQVRFDEGEQWNRHERHPLFFTLLERIPREDPLPEVRRACSRAAGSRSGTESPIAVKSRKSASISLILSLG